MPGLARKLLIVAATDGLVIQPLYSKNQQRPLPPVQIKYGDGTLSPLMGDLTADLDRLNSSFEAFGIVGMLTVSRLPFLMTITRRKQVAQIHGYPIYVATEVTITPCTTYKEAEESVAKTRTDLEQSESRTPDESESESESEDEVEIPPPDDVEDVPSPVSGFSAPSTPHNNGANGSNGIESEIAKNVIKRKGSYGRFAARWFSRGGWMMEQKRSLGMSTNSSSGPLDFEETAQDNNISPTDSGTESEDKPAQEPTSLLPKLLRTTSMMFGTSQSFYFSYEWDLTRSLTSQHEKGLDGERDLFKRVDPLFFWNQHVMRPFIDSGYDGLVLPMIQGFVGQKAFVMDSQPPQTDEWGMHSVELNHLSPPGSPPNERSSLDLRPTEKQFLVTLVSRRSVNRAGLRYLRRGVDEDGYVANAVETEQLLGSPCWGHRDGSRTYSFLQFRGSIPLYFTQSPYSLKPVPVLRHSEDINFKAFRKHMSWMARRFGEVQLVNLVEKKSVEKEIGERYRDIVAKLNKLQGQNQVPFEWFDFHEACRGMKFENVGMLLEALASKLEEFGSSVEAGGELAQIQKGVMRTNCMDCLDRTNVVQSSMAKYMLELQLNSEGFEVQEQKDPRLMWYNALWADNGDAVSKQYASTAAMKGDYTRTRTRDYRGTLTDMGLSLTRFYNGIVNDDFSQAAIDFLLGNVTALVFEEFEASLKTKDPAISVTKIREQAIEMCQRQLAGEDEDFISGWTLLAPEPNSLSAVSSDRMEEVVLMLTDVALYICRFNWSMDKISSFERVQLAHVLRLRAGMYITSTLTAQQTDEARNVGLVIEYKPGKNDVKRVNTRSLSSLAGTTTDDPKEVSSRPGSPGPTGLAGLIAARVTPKFNVESGETKKIALKAPYSQSSAAKGAAAGSLTENELIETICAEVERLAMKSGGGMGGRDPHKGFLTKSDIVSVSDAKKNMGVFDQLGHSIKKLVWA